MHWEPLLSSHQLHVLGVAPLPHPPAADELEVRLATSRGVPVGGEAEEDLSRHRSALDTPALSSGPPVRQ